MEINLGELTGPVIHAGIPAVLAIVFRLNPLVAIGCGILPDLVDKPLSMFGIGGGRYIGHTLLFAAVVIAAFSLWKRRAGIAAAIGLAVHLILDLDGFLPWFYPFKEYTFSTGRFDFYDWIVGYFDLTRSGYELIAVVILALVGYGGLLVYRRYGRQKPESR